MSGWSDGLRVLLQLAALRPPSGNTAWGTLWQCLKLLQGAYIWGYPMWQFWKWQPWLQIHAKGAWLSASPQQCNRGSCKAIKQNIKERQKFVSQDVLLVFVSLLSFLFLSVGHFGTWSLQKSLPDVSLPAVSIPINHFWGHPIWRPRDGLGTRWCAYGLQPLGCSKVTKLDVTRVVAQYIGSWRDTQGTWGIFQVHILHMVDNFHSQQAL